MPKISALTAKTDPSTAAIIPLTQSGNTYYSSVDNLAAAVGQGSTGFVQAGTGATNRSIRAKLRDVISVKDFGALGDGSTDDTAAIQAAAAALTQSTDNFIVSGTTFVLGASGTLFFPKGNYRVSDATTIPPYSRVVGDHATIRCTDTTKNIFNVYGFETSIEGISFGSGAAAINYTHGNENASRSSIKGCEFNGQTDYSIKAIGTFSTKLTISDCKFISLAGVIYTECDEATLENSWVSALTANITYIKTHGNLTLKDMMLVPSFAPSAAEALATYWVQNGNSTTNEGGYTYCHRVRFGGENGGISTAINYATPAGANEVMRGLHFDGCGMWGSSAIVRLSKVPDFVISTKTDWSFDAEPRLEIDESLATLAATPLIDIDFIARGTHSAVVRPHMATHGMAEQNLLSTSSYFTGAAATANTGTGGATANTASIPIFGELNQVTFGSDNGSQLYSQRAYSALSLSAGWYTASIVIKATKDVNVTIGTTGYGANKTMHVPGDGEYHQVAWQFFNPGGLDAVSFGLFNVRTDGVVVTWGDPKLVTGYVDLPSASYHAGAVDSGMLNIGGRLYHSAVPSTGYWYKGAEVLQSTPAAGGPRGWVCTAEGNPGTWQEFGRIDGGGGTVTQVTNKTTGVTLNTRRGQITMEATGSIAAGALAAFTLTNSSIGANDTIVCHRKSGGTASSYRVWVDSVSAGSCVICVENRTGGALAEAVVLQFDVLPGAIA